MKTKDEKPRNYCLNYPDARRECLDPQGRIEELKEELARKNDKIVELVHIIAELRRKK